MDIIDIGQLNGVFADDKESAEGRDLPRADPVLDAEFLDFPDAV